VTGVRRYVRSCDVDQGCEGRPKLGYATEVISFDRSRAYDQSHDIPEAVVRPCSLSHRNESSLVSCCVLIKPSILTNQIFAFAPRWTSTVMVCDNDLE
jgi:hypothetical protein